MEKFFRCWVRWLLKYYGIVLVLTLALAALSYPRMVQLFKTISTDPVDLLPHDYPSVQALLKLRDKLEPKKRFAAVFESDHPENTRKLIADLKTLLEESPRVGQALTTKVGYAFFDEHKLLFLELEDLKDIRRRIDRKIQREKLGPLYISFDEEEDAELDFQDLEEKYRQRYGDEGTDSEYYVSPNGRLYAIYVESKQPNLSMDEERVFQDEVLRIVQSVDIQAYDPSMNMSFSGSTRITEYRALIRDLKIAGIVSGILIFLPLLLRFRRPQYVLLIFLPLAAGIPMGLALSSLWVAKLNVTTSFLFAILGGLGVETGIHVFSRYYEERHAGVTTEAALTDIYLSLGPAVLTAVASLAVTFLLMIFSDFRGFSEFGLISGLGLIVLCLLYFTFFPALMILGEKIRLLKFGGTLREFEGRFSFSPGFVKPMLVLFGLITVFSVWATPRLKFEYDTKKIRADDPAARLDKIRQRATSGERVNNPAAVIVRDPEEAEAVKAAVDKIKEANPETTVQGTNSLYSLVPDKQAEKLEVIRDIQRMLEDDTIKLVPEDKRADLDRFKEALDKTTPAKSEEVPPEIVERFVGNPEIPGTVMLILAKPRLELDDGRNAIAFASEISRIETPMGNFQASSDAIVFADVLTTMIRDSKKVLIISVLSVSFFVFLNFRDFKKTALVMFSILAGVMWVMGVLFLAGIKLNLYNMVMIPAVMGMSIDNSIHVYHRYEQLGKGSLPRVLTTTGVAALMASMTNAAGFFGLIFCTHGGLRSMGLVAAIGLGTCLVTTLLYLPMILKFFEERGARAA